MEPPLILVDDGIRLSVPNNRLLPKGEYELTVRSISKSKLGIFLGLSYNDSPHALVSVRLAIYPNSPIGWGWGFLGNDQHPVQFELVQDWGKRLRESIKKCGGKVSG